ncbi:MAG: glutaminyl-tRNA synthase (glutamine-hydrolyzing) subunit B [Candidatus Sungbacteria bacterium RIFCSPLOWO2_01_FULL_60_25]|uniref:Aspartyl/glutamyl-tRNA(Asn/Gln) amidotransferase subunit B n=1 Tax=Candidatus Sungbacteria bacterium RIFCSPLOWO2_01_FULL_60_25 TaxID=1802281 RepID=A0A1G2L9E8_9BACT|nr:MAG: glutaminyl-tRNA synthase (glutamine-hydrolyzing) subunit B [Candidatus Sungbacteria bacterium RIFCSPLOWO2_01_FULL_60_25]
MTYEPVIGLEIHAELKTRTKMFCDSKNDPDETRPNVNICPVCMGHPGTLPVPNREAIAKVIRVGLALGASIPAFSRFDRKNYFYPDLPKGYQISQYQHPLVTGGALAITLDDGATKSVRITRVHLEEDTGRSIHDPKGNATLLDFNRAGIPLMELVTEPDIRSAEEAKAFATELRQLLQHLDASAADMEKGEMRIEANISLRPVGEKGFGLNQSERLIGRTGSAEPVLGTKVEVKNINSFRFVEKAIRYEIERQTKVLEKGEKVIQETRGWDETSGATVSQRTKEEAHDYRYFPEPDIPPLRIDPEWVTELRALLPELPQEKRRRFASEFNIPAKLAWNIARDRALAGFFEAAVSELQEWLSATGRDPKDTKTFELTANYLTTDLARILADAGNMPIANAKITPENFAELMTYLAEEKISSKTAKTVLAAMFASGEDPSDVIEREHLWQVSDDGALGTVVDTVLAANEKAIADFRAGKQSALQFLLGQIMKSSRGANPEAVKKLLEEKLKSA